MEAALLLHMQENLINLGVIGLERQYQNQQVRYNLWLWELASQPDESKIPTLPTTRTKSTFCVFCSKTKISPSSSHSPPLSTQEFKGILALIPIDSSNAKRTSFPLSRRFFTLLPIHLKPGSVS